jgi:hypothetical protein
MAMESSAILLRMPRGLPRGGFTFFNHSEKFGDVYSLSFGDKRKSPFNALPV